MRKIGITLLIVALAATEMLAQTNFKISKGSEVVVKGTSTLHDWEMKTSAITGKALFSADNKGITDVKDLELSIVSESLKSEKDGMDKNAYKALKTSSNKNITFQSSKLVSLENKGSGYEIVCEGKLQIAGVTKITTVNAACIQDGSSIKCKGEKVFKMTEYQVEPPSFMFGTVNTGEEVTIAFNVVFNK